MTYGGVSCVHFVLASVSVWESVLFLGLIVQKADYAISYYLALLSRKNTHKFIR